MQQCEQTQGVSVYDHGISVYNYAYDLMQGDTEDFRLPTWWSEDILKHIHSDEIIHRYTTMHDCGKPYCLEIDADGKRHFPNHANVSANTWARICPADTIVSELISLDMVLHTETAEQIKARKLPKITAYTLLVVALAELHSNASMFGGIESTSFKIKWKKLNKRGNMLVKEFARG
jgi:hypothetical protein